MGRLTTHVLDTAAGRPAEGVRIELFRLLPGAAEMLVACTMTNADGRTGAPLLQGAEVDYVDSVQGSGFSIKNPQAKTTCGCGSSFSA